MPYPQDTEHELVIGEVPETDLLEVAANETEYGRELEEEQTHGDEQSEGEDGLADAKHTKQERKRLTRQRQKGIRTPPHITLWYWIRDCCATPFWQSFQSQMAGDLLTTGISLIPLLPVWNYLPLFSKVPMPCQLVPDEVWVETQKRNEQLRAERANRPMWKRILTPETFLVVTFLVMIFSMLDGDGGEHEHGHGSKRRRQQMNKRQRGQISRNGYVEPVRRPPSIANRYGGYSLR